MAQVKLNLRNIKTYNLIGKSLRIIGKMAGNPNFPDPHPTLAHVEQVSLNLKNAQIGSMTRDRYKIFIRKTAEAEMKEVLRLLGSYVQNTSNGDELIIKSSGFDVTKKSKKPSLPAQPAGLHCETLGFTGKVKLSWHPVKNAKCYVVEFTTGNPNGQEVQWINAGYSTKSSHIINNLESFKKCHIRVTPIGAAGAGPPSAYCQGVALM